MMPKFLEINGPAGKIEGQITEGNKPLCIVICHPHPQYGGSMNNNVVYALQEAFTEESFSTVAFNFRGVMRSEGSYDNGVGEQEDLSSICTYILDSNPDIKEILLCGYSFGATVAGGIINNSPKYVGYVAISYPITFIPDFLDQARTPKPKFFLMGKKDDFTSVYALEQYFESLVFPKMMKLYDHVDHFWGGYEKIMAKDIAEWVLANF
ncbi:MAG: alpha/beta hydrolase [Promethearchaeota archaeon]